MRSPGRLGKQDELQWMSLLTLSLGRGNGLARRDREEPPQEGKMRLTHSQGAASCPYNGLYEELRKP